jgi:hypothetical protein
MLSILLTHEWSLVHRKPTHYIYVYDIMYPPEIAAPISPVRSPIKKDIADGEPLFPAKCIE